MDQTTFVENVNDRVQKSLGVLMTKNDGYNPDADKLAGFKRAAQLQNMPARRALGGMMTKHTLSVYDIIESDTVASEELVDEKLGDLINYCLLLSAVLEDERKAEREAQPQLANAEEKFVGDWYEMQHIFILGLDKPLDYPALSRVAVPASPHQAHIFESLGYEEYFGQETYQDLKTYYDGPQPKATGTLADDPSLAALREKLSVPASEGANTYNKLDGPGWYEHPEKDNVWADNNTEGEALRQKSYTRMHPQPEAPKY